MESTGFYRKGDPAASVCTSEAQRSPSAEKHFRYKTAFASEGLGATAIFELSESPCIYFKYLEDATPSDEHLTDIHRLAWNHGLAPMLWVVTPTTVQIYNCYSRPTSTSPQEHQRHLLRVFRNVACDLEALNRFAGRLEYETGRFWRTTEAQRIDHRQRVDESLLNDLASTEDDLISAGLPAPVAHALLGRSIFIAYLQDRNILKPQFFRANFQNERFVDVLQSKAKTDRLFNWVRRTFNGDMFPPHSTERRLVKQKHLKIINRLLEGTGRFGQMRLWPYRFDVIPVELISSIYEMFAHSLEGHEAEERGTHYTPMNLVDLVLSQTFKGMSADGKVADLSCGSGVFLVEALRRLVSLRLERGEHFSRKLVRDTLHDQVFGLDISPEAVQIAAFSLYLTALELDPDPQPPSALRFRPLVGENLFVADAFDESAEFNNHEVFRQKNLAAIVGNPPWTRTASTSSNAKYCEKHGHPTARKGTPDQAFIWRVGDFASDTTRIGLILHAKPFFSHEPSARTARKAIIKRFSPELMLNLAELRQLRLFPSAVAPALVFIGTGTRPADEHSFVLASARRAEHFRNHGIITISPDNVRRLRVGPVASDPDMLKVATWGAARDMALIRDLRSRDRFLQFGQLLRRLHWPHGRGAEPGGSNRIDRRFPHRFLASAKMLPFALDVSALPRRDDHLSLRRGHSRPEIYNAPLLIATRGLQDQQFYSAIASAPVIYTQLYMGFSADPEHSDTLHLLNAILNSKVATYFLFMTASSWGVERSTVEMADLYRLPVPDPEAATGNVINDTVTIGRALARAAASGAIPDDSIRDLNDAVYTLYGIDDEARILIEDAIDITIDSRRTRSIRRAFTPPTLPQMTQYAEQTMRVLCPFLSGRRARSMAAEILDVKAAPLKAVRFSMVPASATPPQITCTHVPDMAAILQRIEGQLRRCVADDIYGQMFIRIYAKDELYIVKPGELRYWSRSAALNDADDILAEHLGVRSGLH